RSLGTHPRSHRAQALVDPRHRFRPGWVVVGDELAGAVEDHLGRARVVGEDYLARPGIEFAERDEVAGRGAAPAVDRLAVVASDFVLRRQQARLGPRLVG